MAVSSCGFKGELNVEFECFGGQNNRLYSQFGMSKSERTKYCYNK
jgi:hypothetical protein